MNDSNEEGSGGAPEAIARYGFVDDEKIHRIGGPHGYCTNFDWRAKQDVVFDLSLAVEGAGFVAMLPRCRRGNVDMWLEEVNFLIGQRTNFVDGKTYELIDLARGSDIYRILFCPKGYKFPEWAMDREE